MTRLQLAEIIHKFGKIDRKSLQNLVFYLQKHGNDFDCDFVISYKGPYSQYLANVLDDLVNEKIVKEICSEKNEGSKYEYIIEPDKIHLLNQNTTACLCDNQSKYIDLENKLSLSMKEVDKIKIQMQDLKNDSYEYYYADSSLFYRKNYITGFWSILRSDGWLDLNPNAENVQNILKSLNNNTLKKFDKNTPVEIASGLFVFVK